MDLQNLAARIHDLAVADWIRSTVRAVPILESTHVLAVCIVFGTILIVDLRLLGYAGMRRAFSRVSNELLPMTWWAFGAAVVTGALLFSLNSITYYGNTAFRVKMVLLLLAGVNMFVFHRYTMASIAAWDDKSPPTAARLSGAVSLLLWVAALFVGRWVGFTKGYDFGIPEDVNIDSLFTGR